MVWQKNGWKAWWYNSQKKTNAAEKKMVKVNNDQEMQILKYEISLYTYQFDKYLIMQIITRIKEDVGNESFRALLVWV